MPESDRPIDYMREAQRSIEGIQSSVRNIKDLIAPSEDARFTFPTLYPTQYCDETTPLIEVNMVSVNDIGYVDSNVRTTIIGFTDAIDASVPGKTVFGMLLETGAETLNAQSKFLVTEVLTDRTLSGEVPSFNEFHTPTLVELEQFDDSILYDATFNLRALATPWDVPYPQEQVPEVREWLEDSKATIPGISLLGRLTIDVDFDC